MDHWNCTYLRRIAPRWRSNKPPVSIRQEFESLVLTRGKDEEEIKSKFSKMI